MVKGSNPLECVNSKKLKMFSLKNLLVYILLFPIFGILMLLFIPARNEKLLKIVALNWYGVSFRNPLEVFSLW
jgi:hypothetical protein